MQPLSSTLTFDHSQRSCYQMCKRMYLFRHICGIHKATPESGGFAFGSAFHASSEVIDITGDINAAMALFSDMFNFPDDKVRTLIRARELLTNYQKYTKQQGWEFLQTSPSTMEIAFNKPLAERINYAGRCDRKFKDGAIGEWKTTYYLYNSSGNPIPYLQQWWGHNSIRGYAWANEANAVYLLGVGVYPQKPQKGAQPYQCVESLRIPVERWEIEQFVREATEVGNEILQAYDRYGFSLEDDAHENNLNLMFEKELFKYFPTNTSRCYFNINNPCQFIDLCTRNVPHSLVDANYIVDPFLPWLEESNGD